MDDVKNKRPILTLDFETDPFKYQRRPKPFAGGVYDGKDFFSVWHKTQTAEKLVKHLDTLEPSIIYIHNGGRFDLHYLQQYLDPDMRIINGRIVECRLHQHIIRDSYAIIPVPLKAYKKDDIDISKLELDVREKHRDEIISYMRGDCVYLHELVSAFIEEFGDFTTIASAAFAQLKKFHDITPGNSFLDSVFRTDYFYGGRVECFKSGIINEPFKIYDVNSMYPYVMANCLHPISKEWDVKRTIGPKTNFVCVEGTNTGPYGCFPVRKRDGGITCSVERGIFNVSIHEFNTALDIGWFKPDRIIRTFDFDESGCFDRFVEHFYSARLHAKSIDDLLHVLFYKLILNSAYGKFAQNPLNFADWCITGPQEMMPEPWQLHILRDERIYNVWKRSTSKYVYHNVATGASITGAARSVLLRAISRARQPFYCDTDSIVCSGLNEGRLNDSSLGAWKLEASGTGLAIAGKKLYACFDGNGTTSIGPETECVKMASKGGKITPAQILEICDGNEVKYFNQAPTFKLDGRTTFVKRTFRKTA